MGSEFPYRRMIFELLDEGQTNPALIAEKVLAEMPLGLTIEVLQELLTNDIRRAIQSRRSSERKGHLLDGECLTTHQLQKVISTNTSAGLEHTRQAYGTRLGRPEMIPDSIIQEIIGNREQGWTFQSISDELNRRNVPTSHGGKMWRTSTIRGVCKRYEVAS